MKKIPTAEEFIQNFLIKNHKGIVGSNTEMLMKEFAKLHVEAALYIASEMADLTDNGSFPYVDKTSILTSYSLDKIK